jgi:hypothetical protein
VVANFITVDLKKLIKKKAIELIVLVIIILGLNIAPTFIENQILSNIIVFVNQNIPFILLLWLMGAINDASASLSFPLELISPPINGANSIIIIMFILKIFKFIDTIMLDFSISLYDLFNPFTSKYYTHIFVVIMLFGYGQIFLNRIFKKHKQRKEKKKTDKIIEEEEEEKEKKEIDNTNIDKKDNDLDSTDSKKPSSTD